MSLFKKRISVYRDIYDKEGCVCTLGAFLFSRKHKEEIERIRGEEDEEMQKKMKLTLPCATISGVFSHRNTKEIVDYSGLICIDIDGKENQHLAGRWEEVKKELSEVQEIAYIGLSVRGNGLFCIIPIAYPESHLQHFLQLRDDFISRGIVIDASCKDVSRLRFISYDPHPYVNENAKIYTRLKEVQKPTKKPFAPMMSSDETIDKVLSLCMTIDHEGIDLTQNYQEWFTIGCALADLGEDGRLFYHICSRQNEKYNESECDKKFDNLLRTTYSWHIGTFFHICNEWGIKG